MYCLQLNEDVMRMYCLQVNEDVMRMYCLQLNEDAMRMYCLQLLCRLQAGAVCSWAMRMCLEPAAIL